MCRFCRVCTSNIRQLVIHSAIMIILVTYTYRAPPSSTIYTKNLLNIANPFFPVVEVTKMILRKVQDFCQLANHNVDLSQT
jgi:hypothetical protein